jgi:putative transport protein
MVRFVANLIGSQPILTLFLAIGLGYAVGQINILGFSLGIGAVLFVGLFLGAIAPKAQIAGPIGLWPRSQSITLRPKASHCENL